MNFIPEFMKGIHLIGHGELDKLEFSNDIPIPTPGPRDVLIKVGAAGINNTDINTRIGWYSKTEGNSSDASWSGNAIIFPRIQGADVCGTVVAAGEQVDSELLNTRVLVEPCITEAKGSKLDQPWYFGSECDGGFAEYTVVAAQHVYPVNSSFTDVELASFPCSYSTAENLLTRANVIERDIVLVTGSSGGVGSAVIQLAKARGARVIGITSPSKVDSILKLGAEKTILRSENLSKVLGENTVDVIIDLVAGKQWPELIDVLKPFGRYAVSGAIGGPHVSLDVRTLYLKDLSLYGCTVLDKKVFRNLIKRIESGEIKPLVAETFPLSKIKEAQNIFLSKQHVGKLVIDLTLTD